MVLLAHTSLQHLDEFIRFCSTHGRDRHRHRNTQTDTDHAVCDIAYSAIGGVCAMYHVCGAAAVAAGCTNARTGRPCFATMMKARTCSLKRVRTRGITQSAAQEVTFPPFQHVQWQKAITPNRVSSFRSTASVLCHLSRFFSKPRAFVRRRQYHFTSIKCIFLG